MNNRQVSNNVNIHAIDMLILSQCRNLRMGVIREHLGALTDSTDIDLLYVQDSSHYCDNV